VIQLHTAILILCALAVVTAGFNLAIVKSDTPWIRWVLNTAWLALGTLGAFVGLTLAMVQ
jgi:hypothetical protein